MYWSKDNIIAAKKLKKMNEYIKTLSSLQSIVDKLQVRPQPTTKHLHEQPQTSCTHELRQKPKKKVVNEHFQKHFPNLPLV